MIVAYLAYGKKIIRNIKKEGAYYNIYHYNTNSLTMAETFSSLNSLIKTWFKANKDRLVYISKDDHMQIPANEVKVIYNLSNLFKY